LLESYKKGGEVMGFTDTVKWQEKALGIMDRGLSVIAYNNYLLKSTYPLGYS